MLFLPEAGGAEGARTGFAPSVPKGGFHSRSYTTIIIALMVMVIVVVTLAIFDIVLILVLILRSILLTIVIIDVLASY